MIRIYRQPQYGYWVLAVGKASFRIGQGRSDHPLAMMFSGPCERFHTKALFVAVWIFGLCMQLDWNLNDGGVR